jgi:uncharacterized protein
MIEVHDNADGHRFETRFADGSIAFAEYRIEGDRIIFPHTVVPPAHEGQGVASQLARTALAAARERGLKVVPVCPFFAAYIARHAETQDLLADDCRGKLPAGG